MRSAPLALVALLVTGCAGRPRLDPAPSALAVPGIGRGAEAVEAGVRVEARVDAWSGIPANLAAVTPILAQVENLSDVPLRLRYRDFWLEGPQGERWAALSPFHVEGRETVAVQGYYPHRGFYVSPFHARHYPWLDPWPGIFPDPFYDPWGPTSITVQLPTADMVAKALPEGVLEPGGQVTGFLYFENVERSVAEVAFTATLVNARTGEPFGVLQIPFVVDGGRRSAPSVAMR